MSLGARPTDDRPVRVFLVDDHEVVRRGVAEVLEDDAQVKKLAVEALEERGDTAAIRRARSIPISRSAPAANTWA